MIELWNRRHWKSLLLKKNVWVLEREVFSPMAIKPRLKFSFWPTNRNWGSFKRSTKWKFVSWIVTFSSMVNPLSKWIPFYSASWWKCSKDSASMFFMNNLKSIKLYLTLNCFWKNWQAREYFFIRRNHWTKTQLSTQPHWVKNKSNLLLRKKYLTNFKYFICMIIQVLGNKM